MIAAYSSDITPVQFELIEHDLQFAQKTTRPRKYALYDLFCALLYVLEEGCAWRGLPHDFPKWNIVYHYYQIWSSAGKNREESLLDKIMRKLVLRERVIDGREPETGLL